MMIDTQKLEVELKQALANCGLPTDKLKIVTKHTSDTNDDLKQFGFFESERWDLLGIQMTLSFKVES